MTRIRIGTRGSQLALIQTRIVTNLLKASHPGVEFEEIIIRTHGDSDTQSPFDIHWPVGGFTSAIEQALLRGEIDLAAHSYKDLPTATTPGLVIAAVPPREAAHDVLVSREPVSLNTMPAGFRIGTSSPRRAAQMRWFCGLVSVLPLRGNVPTRLAKVSNGELDAAVLAAAGLTRLGVTPQHAIDLPADCFVPAPAQGALAVQTRDEPEWRSLAAPIEHLETRLTVEAEREFLRAIGAGCHTPAAARASVTGHEIELTAQLFTDDGSKMVQGVEKGTNGLDLAARLAARLPALIQSV